MKHGLSFIMFYIRKSGLIRTKRQSPRQLTIDNQSVKKITELAKARGFDGDKGVQYVHNRN